jgi:(p)ppGpp synthase/HD superfamily hydrolase
MRKGEMLSRMLALAVAKHNNQFDRGGVPYILHPLKVMHYINSTDEELQCIALGHDLVEDTDTTWQDLANAGMSERVIKGIEVLTKRLGETYDDYRMRILESRDAMIVKMADLRHNSDIRRLKGVTEKDVRRIEKYHRFYLEIQEKLKNC